MPEVGEGKVAVEGDVLLSLCLESIASLKKWLDLFDPILEWHLAPWIKVACLKRVDPDPGTSLHLHHRDQSSMEELPLIHHSPSDVLGVS